MVELFDSKDCILFTKPFHALIILRFPSFTSLCWIHSRDLISTWMIELKIQKSLSYCLRSQHIEVGLGLEPIFCFLVHCSIHIIFLTWEHFTLTSYLSSSMDSLRNSVWGWEYLGTSLLSNLMSETFHWWNAGEAFCGQEGEKRCYFKHCWESLGKIHLADRLFPPFKNSSSTPNV